MRIQFVLPFPNLNLPRINPKLPELAALPKKTGRFFGECRKYSGTKMQVRTSPNMPLCWLSFW